MADSYLLHPQASASPKPDRRKVLVTGAAGRIGSYFVQNAPDRYELTLLEHPEADTSEIESRGKVEKIPLSQLEQLKELFAGQDTVVHLAAEPSPSATWDELHRDNILGTYNAFVAAASAKCRRVVYASSIHAVSGYQDDRQVHADEPVSPGDLYGVTKCFGEALGRYLATEQGLSCIAIRIGAFQPRSEGKQNVGLISTFVSQPDLHQLILNCIDDERLLFAIVHGLSRNKFNRMDISEARELLGYKPEDDMTELNQALESLDLARQASPHNESHGPASGIRKEL